jgi:hypothetical protein
VDWFHVLTQLAKPVMEMLSNISSQKMLCMGDDPQKKNEEFMACQEKLKTLQILPSNSKNLHAYICFSQCLLRLAYCTKA